MIGKESLLPTQTEVDEYGRKLDKHWGRVKVAGITGIVFAAATGVFPFAIGGTLVAVEEVARHTITMDIEVIKFHSKYPGLDKK